MRTVRVSEPSAVNAFGVAAATCFFFDVGAEAGGQKELDSFSFAGAPLLLGFRGKCIFF